MSEQNNMPIQDERLLGYLMGFGLTLMILAGLVEGFNPDTQTKTVVIIGFALFVLGFFSWLAIFRPWHRFDDLTTPFFTGHDHAADHAAEAHVEVAQEAAVAAAAEPVKSGVPATVPKAQTAIEPHVIHAPAPKEAPAPAADEEVVEIKVEIEEDAAPPDDLTVIEGIGPKTNEALHAAGITSFTKLAGMAPDAISAVLSDAKVRIVSSPDTWPQQARLAAQGDLDGLKELQDKLKGGVAQEDMPPAEPDNLTLIEGIGPKTNSALQAAGITTFAKLAGMTPDEIGAVLTEAKVRIVSPPDTWPQQAALAADGDIDGLKALQDKLKGGVLPD